MSSALEKEHRRRIEDICRKIRASYADQEEMPSRVPGNIPRLDDIIEIDRYTLTAKVEADVRMGRLVEATLSVGLLPSVVAGERNMTVAGAFADMTSESSSFAFGTFDCTVLEVEMILSDGSLVEARHDEEAGYFYGNAGTTNRPVLSTMFTLSLKRSGPYVALEIVCLSSADIEALKAALDEGGERNTSMKRSRSLTSGHPSSETRLQDLTRLPDQVYSMRPVAKYTTSWMSGEKSVQATLESEVVGKMLWAASDSSVEFIEAIMFGQLSGVILGRTSPTYCGPLIKPSKARSFTDIVRNVTDVPGPQVLFMETNSYLFRHDPHQPAKMINDRSKVESLTQTKPVLGKYGVCADAVGALVKQQDWSAWPLRIHPVLSSRSIGRKARSGIYYALNVLNDMYFILGTLEFAASGGVARFLRQKHPMQKVSKDGRESEVPLPLQKPQEAHDCISQGSAQRGRGANVFSNALEQPEPTYRSSLVNPYRGEAGRTMNFCVGEHAHVRLEENFWKSMFTRTHKPSNDAYTRHST